MSEEIKLYPSEERTLEKPIEKPPYEWEGWLVNPKELLESFGIKEGEPVPYSVLREILDSDRSEILEGLQRNFYMAIKMSLYHKRWQDIREENFILRRPVNHDQEKELIDFVWFMEEGGQTFEERRKCFDGFKIVFTFSTTRQRIDSEDAFAHERFFSGNDAFALEKVVSGRFPIKALDNRQEYKNLPEQEDEGTVSYYELIKFLEMVSKKPELFREANLELDKLGNKYRFPKEDIEKIKQAIWEFGNHTYKTRKGFHMIGECLVIPLEFIHFVEKRFGIKLNHCDLTGAKKRRAKLSAEERAELDAARAETAVHFATIYKGTIIIDWTSRQFRGDAAPIPEIVDLNEHAHYREMIDIED